MKQNLSINEAADLLGTSARTIYRLVSDGELVGFKVRNALRITGESLESYRRRQIAIYQSANGINIVQE